MENNIQGTTPPSSQTQEPSSREEKININMTQEILNGKSKYCRFYRNGHCLVSAKDCKFAHGLKDLQFKKLDLDEFNNSLKTKEAEGKSKVKEKEKEDQEDQVLIEKNSEKESSLTQKMSYKDLYEHQFVLKERGEIDTIYTLEDINNTKSIRESLGAKHYRDLQQEFMDFLYKEYGTRALKREFIDKCFLNIDWMVSWKYILDKSYAYEAKSFVVKQLAGEAFDDYMEDCIVKIIKDNGLLSDLPISPSLINKLYYQHLGPLDPYLPSHQIYLRYKDIKSMDDYLEKLQYAESFRKKLAEAVGKTEEEITNVTLFEHSSNKMNELMTQIRAILLELIERSHIGFILYSRYDDTVMQECSQRLQQFNSNLPQIKKLMAKTALQENILIVNLNSALYLFALDKFKKSNLTEIRGKYYEKLYTSCPLPPSDHIALHQMPSLRPEKFDVYIPDRQTDEFLNKEIDIQKVVVVDNEETLQQAIQHFEKVDAIGVDLEGDLRKNGRLELVQCGSREKIFIFDIYQAKLMAKNDEKYVNVYKSIASYVKKLVEDPKICKIFHDGRKDSLALHVFLDACPSNVFDLSAVFMLIEHLEQYKTQKSHGTGSHEETKKEENAIANGKVSEKHSWNPADEPKLPGLNEVLDKYQASHGLNKLKNIMKSRFGAVPIEYFLKRPIDKEFLVYSARDVEDLVEVKEKMEQELKELLKVFVGGNLEEERVDLLCKKVSKTYALHGCDHKAQS